jgi:WD40 repeat protein
VASGSDDKTIKLWRVSDGALVRTLTGHTNWVNRVAFSPDGTLLASGGLDNTIKLWRVSDGALVRTLTGHTNYVLSVAFSPDGTLLASGSYDKTVKLWRVSDGALVRTYDQETGTGVLSVQFSPDGQYFGYGRYDAAVVLARVPYTSAYEDLLQSLGGWTTFVATPSNAASVDYDAAQTALRASVVSDASRFRVAGWMTDSSRWLPYYAVGPNKVVRERDPEHAHAPVDALRAELDARGV